MDISDWIALIGVIINSALAYWIVKTIQSKLTNRRVLKDYFINEIKEIRTEFKGCLNNLYNGKTPPKLVTPWFKLMNIKVTELMNNLHRHYDINPYYLRPFQEVLPDLITNNPDFIRQFRQSEPVVFSESTKIDFIKFQQKNSQLFTDLIIEVNNS